MPKSLREKISLLLDDAEGISKSEKIKLVERLVNEELGFLSMEHDLSAYDIGLIKSAAINKFNEMRMDREALGPIQGDGDDVRAFCYVESVIGFLRNKGLINFTLRYTRKR